MQPLAKLLVAFISSLLFHFAILQGLNRMPGVKMVDDLLQMQTSMLIRMVARNGTTLEAPNLGENYMEALASAFNPWGDASISDNPENFLDSMQMITKYGYVAEEHEIITEDGYILKAHRIPGGPKYPPRSGKPVVYLQHGILTSSMDWVVLGPRKSLGFILSDEGYDVWLGNSRGNTYSRSHVSLQPTENRFWNFSFHEMGIYDLPATIDYILSVTGRPKVFYLGHSQGTTSVLVMLSERPDYNDKVQKVVAFAPIAYVGNMRTPLLNLIMNTQTNDIYVKLRDTYEVLPDHGDISNTFRNSCKSALAYETFCTNLLDMAFGEDDAQLKQTMPVMIAHVPAGSSTKQIMHYVQEKASKKFRPFDDFGELDPAEYNLGNVKAPVGLFYSENDLLSDTKDVEILARKLPNVQLLYKVPRPTFNHIGYLYAMNATTLVYSTLLNFLKN